jgi:hypothetical protein
MVLCIKSLFAESRRTDIVIPDPGTKKLPKTLKRRIRIVIFEVFKGTGALFPALFL